MQQTWKLRLSIALAILGIAFYYLYPTIVYFSLGEKEIKDVRENKDAFSKYIPSWAPKNHIVPGLDLQGGIHMVLGIDINKAITDKTARAADRIIGAAKDAGIKVESSKQSGEDLSLQDRVQITFTSAADVDAFKEKVLKKFADFVFVSAKDASINLRLDSQFTDSIRHDAVSQTIKTIINRIDKMGVTEPSISRRGDDQVQIQLAGYDDPEQAKMLLGRTAQLQFQLCDDTTKFLTTLTNLPEGVELVQSSNDIFLTFQDEKLNTVKEYLTDKVPSDFVVKFGKAGNGDPNDKTMRTYTLQRKIPLTGDDLIDARVSPGSDTNPRPGVSLTFSHGAAKIFAELTRTNIGKRMAIVLEDIVDSAPVISTEIPNGNAFISMGGARSSQEMAHDANQLALVLKAGALPAPVTFREEKSVGPSLGKDSVDEAVTACAVGALLIALFMMFYYRAVGVTSIIAVIFNMVFILATLSILNATITLPGIAALLLTVGMAVDANVIINERIREELRLGKMPRSAVKAGYDAAMTAIIDTHVTTVISGIVLWHFGSGPVQNFATLLVIGTVSSVLTAIFITRIFVDMLTSRNPKTLSV
jgi:preprotein translocase subunit SecD